MKLSNIFSLLFIMLAWANATANAAVRTNNEKQPVVEHWLVRSAKGATLGVYNSVSAATNYVKNNPGTVLSYATTAAAAAAAGFIAGRKTAPSQPITNVWK